MESTRSSLLCAIQEGPDSARWHEFETVYQPVISAYARRQGVPWHEVEELVQQVFIKIWQGVDSFDRGKARFRTWLYQVARNAVYDWFRGRQKDVKIERAAIENLQPEAYDPLDKLDQEWEREAHHRVLRAAVERVRVEVAPETWSCFEQHVLLGRPAADVARDLNKQINAVYTNASRVLARLRAACDDLLEDLGDDP